MTAVTPGARGNQFNLVAQARRQPGSTFKTFVLTAAIEQGMNPDSTYYTSSPFHYQPDPYTPAWDVSTYDHSYSGTISVTSATLASDNTVYAQLTLDVGPEAVAEMAHRLGVQSALDVVPAMGLGADAISPLEEASAYATLAAGGVYSKPMAIRKVVLANGKVDTDAGWGQPQRRRAISDGVAYEVTQILEDNVLEGTGSAPTSVSPAAGKTGHDRQPRRRVVLRLRSSARDDGLGRLSAGRDPDGERPRDLCRRRYVPGHDLEAVHGVRAPERAFARLATAPGPRSSGGPSRRVSTRRASRPHRPRTTHRRRRPRGRRPGRARPRHDSAAGPAPRDSGATASAAAPWLHLRRRRILLPASAGVAACGWRCAPQSSRSRCSWRLAPSPTAASSGRRGSGTLHIYQGYAEKLLDGSLPYRDVFVEYPPGAFAVFLPPTAFGADHYNAAFKTLMALCGVATIVLVALVLVELGASRRRLYAAVGLLALSPLALGPISAQHLRRLAGAPDRARPVALPARARRSRIRGARAGDQRQGLPARARPVGLHLRVAPCRPAPGGVGLAALVLVAAVVVAPFAAYAPHGVFESFRSQAERGLQVESLGASFLLLLDRLGLYDAQVVRRRAWPAAT